jgi:hypothetical protein
MDIEPVAPEKADTELQPLEQGYLRVLRIEWAITMAVLLAIAAAVDLLVLRGNALPWGWLSGAVLLLSLWAVLTLPTRQFLTWGHSEEGDALRVVHGYMFHTDTVVPFVRVQHIDVGQGPIERLCGVSHLVVHTAGTHNSIVTLPGLDPVRAAEIRDSIRARIQTDFA